VVVGEVPADRVRAGVQTYVVELFAQPQYQFDGLRRGRCRTGQRSTRQRLERVLALEPVAGHELADPALGHPVGAGYLGLGLAGQNCRDDKATLRHPAACESPAMPKTCDTRFRCPETPHSDVLNQDTVSPTHRLEARKATGRCGALRASRHSLLRCRAL